MSKIKDMIRNASSMKKYGSLSGRYTGIDPASRQGTNPGGERTGSQGGGRGRRGRRPGPGVGPPRTPLSPQPVMRAPR